MPSSHNNNCSCCGCSISGAGAVALLTVAAVSHVSAQRPVVTSGAVPSQQTNCCSAATPPAAPLSSKYLVVNKKEYTNQGTATRSRRTDH